MKIYRICDGCNKEFDTKATEEIGGLVTATLTCPHCTKPNHVWVKVTNESE